MTLKRIIIQSLFLLSLIARAAYAADQGLPSEATAPGAITFSNDTLNGQDGKCELEKARLNAEELSLIKGRAFDISLPDIRSTMVAGITLWDEVKNKRGATSGNAIGQFTGTIIRQGR